MFWRHFNTPDRDDRPAKTGEQVRSPNWIISRPDDRVGDTRRKCRQKFVEAVDAHTSEDSIDPEAPSRL